MTILTTIKDQAVKIFNAITDTGGNHLTPVAKLSINGKPFNTDALSRIISENDANVTGVDHTRVGGSLSMGDVSITIDMETKGVEHCRQVISALEDEGFKPIIVY